MEQDSKTDNKGIFKYALACVCLFAVNLGLWFGSNIIQTNESESRSPASASNPIEEKKRFIDSNNSVDIKCKEILQSLQTETSLLQIKSEYCLKGASVEITNETNQFSASIFVRGNNHFMTDYIPLEDGSNLISVRYRDEKNELKKYSIVVEKKPEEDI